MNGVFEGESGLWLRRFLLVTAIFLAAFLLVETIAGLMNLRYIGTGVAASNTITVSGYGEVDQVPNIATFTYSVSSTQPTVAAAQNIAAQTSNAITTYLTGAGVASTDIQTSGYSVYPQYEYQNAACPQVQSSGTGIATPIYCPPGKQVLTGYTVSQSTTVKVRDTSKAGDLLSGVGSKGATNVSSLTFTFDKPNAVQDQARSSAIADAKQKADTLAQELGVSLVRVVSFNENTGGVPEPMPLYAANGTASSARTAPVISPGQNTVTDDVTITYEIR